MRTFSEGIQRGLATMTTEQQAKESTTIMLHYTKRN
jgi:hypothetical protein